ncbi:hypothetical protein PM082_000113 [Marasmius tenuissimus]|nr:hypothetical protein PM082_000113 [Marasmius tenuissimus]
MHYHQQSLVLLFLAVVSSVLSIPTGLAITNTPLTPTNDTGTDDFLGINCAGSGLCSLISDRLSQISSLLDGVPSDRQYTDGYNIACQNNLCAFYQSMGSGVTSSGARANELVKGLLNFGCQVCGSNPILAGNDVSTGQLTVNYVSKPACQGICWN